MLVAENTCNVGEGAVVRQGHLIAVIVVVLLVALLYPSPAYGDSKAGDTYVRVKAGTPVTVLGLYRVPPASGCDPPNALPCKPHTYAVAKLPNGEVVLLWHKAVAYQTQTVRVDSNAPGPLTPREVNDFLRLSDTGGAELLPLLGAVMLFGGGLVTRRALTAGFQGQYDLATVAEDTNEVGR